MYYNNYFDFSIKNIHVQYSLPDDEHVMFETCRKHEELN